MGIVAVKLIHNYKADLESQLEKCTSVTGVLRSFVLEYLEKTDVSSLDDITIEDIMNYREYVEELEISNTQKKYYKNLLEQVTYAYLFNEYPETYQLSQLIITERAIRNKTVGYLLINGITDFSDINFEIRDAYSKYLAEIVTKRKVGEHEKALDSLKLWSIKKENTNNILGSKTLKYENKKIYLGYHPDYEKAMSFYYIQNKEELLFDFSVSASAILKKQIFKMLNNILETSENRHDRRERYIFPLKHFFNYCIENEIEDVESILKNQVDGFMEYLDEKVSNTLTDSYMQVVDNTLKYLFMSAKTINWSANVWYLDRFSFDVGRANPASDIRRISFWRVTNNKNRKHFKLYMRYRLGISAKSAISTIRAEYYEIKEMLIYFDEKEICVDEATSEDVEAYINHLEKREIQPEYFNRKVITIAKFYGYLFSKSQIRKMPVPFAEYLKKTFMRHNDRFVSLEIQDQILSVLGDFPEVVRLIYLNLYCTGLRINEVCAIKGDAYVFDGKDAWIKVYQNKMKSEKYEPIPTMLYEVMKKFINENHIEPDNYIFKSSKGGAYRVGTFCKQFKRNLEKAGITNYKFRSHDFRHSIATYLYWHGTSIEVIRDYLGHKDSNMTRQYLDFMPMLLDKANEEYFKKGKKDEQE